MFDLLRKANLATGLLTVFAVVNIAVFGLQFLGLWLHRPWVWESNIVSLLTLPAFGVALLQGPSSGMLFGMGRLKGQTLITFIEAFLNIALSVVLVRSMGIYGICLGATIPMLLIRGVAFPLVFTREMGMGLREYYGMYALPALLTVLYAPAAASLTLVHYRNFFELFIGCLGSTALFVALCFALPQSRALLLPYWRRATGGRGDAGN
jgi:O-antigen/teichoic acid export membrane protein